MNVVKDVTLVPAVSEVYHPSIACPVFVASGKVPIALLSHKTTLVGLVALFHPFKLEIVPPFGFAVTKAPTFNTKDELDVEICVCDVKSDTL